MSNSYNVPFNKKYFKQNTKLCLSYNGLMNQNELFDLLNEDNYDKNAITNPFYKLIDNYEDIKIILKNKDINIIEYLYLNKNQISKILYNEDANIHIHKDYFTKFSDYYYFYFLVKDNITLDYLYDIEVIYNLDEIIKITEEEIKKIILSKILVQLIESMIGEFEDKDIDKCNNIKINYLEFINKEKNIFKKYNIYEDLNELNFKDKQIDEIYGEILISLIKNNKLDKSNKTISLLKELDIKNIRLNKTILNCLMEVLIEDNLKLYLLSSYNDLFDENKLFFYHTLLVYILKSSDYIFHIPFLLKTREEIIRIINQHIDELALDLKKGKNGEKIIILKEVLNYFIDLDYYVNKSNYNKKKIGEIKQEEKSLGESSDSDSNEDLKSDNHSESASLSEHHSCEDPYDQFSFSYNLNEDIAYKFMSESTFTISVNYNKYENKGFIEYKKIICEQKDYQIEDVKNIKSENEITNYNYGKFIKFLEIVENELIINCKKLGTIDIDLKFCIDNTSSDEYKVNCYYFVNDDTIIDKEFEFEDCDILNADNCIGLVYMIDEISY